MSDNLNKHNSTTILDNSNEIKNLDEYNDVYANENFYKYKRYMPNARSIQEINDIQKQDLIVRPQVIKEIKSTITEKLVTSKDNNYKYLLYLIICLLVTYIILTIFLFIISNLI
jgi:uncharacterized membrane protein